MITPFHIAQRYVGFKEVEGKTANPAILSMLQLDNAWPSDDSVPWCSAFCNHIFWLCGMPRSKSLRARSWLAVGTPVEIADAVVGFDVVVLQRGSGDQPDATNLTAPGHVGLFAGMDGSKVLVLGGNQSDSVNVRTYHRSKVLGIRRIQ